MTERQRLPNPRAAETFEFEAVLKHAATVGFVASSTTTKSVADINARDAAITFSIAVQPGVDPNVIRIVVSHNPYGTGGGALAAALDIINAWT
jgi:hypothetical protein